MIKQVDMHKKVLDEYDFLLKQEGFELKLALFFTGDNNTSCCVVIGSSIRRHEDQWGYYVYCTNNTDNYRRETFDAKNRPITCEEPYHFYQDFDKAYLKEFKKEAQSDFNHMVKQLINLDTEKLEQESHDNTIG